MSQLVALIFDDPYKADEARALFLRLVGEGLGELDESAVIARRADGTYWITQEVDQVKKGQRIGHMVGIVAAAATGMLPLIFVGTLAGRLLGKLTDHGITDKFVKQIKEEVQPGTSCLIILGRSDPERRKQIVERMRPFNPKILKSDLPPEVEQEIEDQLKQAA